jgi:hypothetical protein
LDLLSILESPRLKEEYPSFVDARLSMLCIVCYGWILHYVDELVQYEYCYVYHPSIILLSFNVRFIKEYSQ